ILVIDMLEQGLDKATQEALITRLRLRGPGAPPLFFLTRSTAILDSVGAAEAIIFCPANHSAPIRVAPYPGMLAMRRSLLAWRRLKFERGLRASSRGAPTRHDLSGGYSPNGHSGGPGNRRRNCSALGMASWRNCLGSRSHRPSSSRDFGSEIRMSLGEGSIERTTLADSDWSSLRCA